MKTRLIFLLAISALITTSCDHQIESPNETPSKLTITKEEALAHIESIGSITRSSSLSIEPVQLLPIGDYEVNMIKAQSSSTENIYSIDIPLKSEYNYYKVKYDSLGDPTYVKLHHKMVLVRDASNNINNYILFYIPNDDYTSKGELEYANMLNCGSKDDYSGLMVYTTIDGIPVYIAYYNNGQKVNQVHIPYSATETMEERIAKLDLLLDGIIFMKVTNPNYRPMTRETGHTYFDIDGGNVQDIIVIGHKPMSPNERQDIYNSLFPEHNIIVYITLPNDDDFFIGGGGNGGGSVLPPSSENARYKHNNKLNINGNSKIEKILDELWEDCFGRTLINSITANINFMYFDSLGRPEGVFKPNTHGWRIELYGVNKVVLAEELTHVFQHQWKTQTYMHERRFNLEVEAKLGWYLFCQRNNLNLNTYQYVFNGENGITLFGQLANYYHNNDFSSPEFHLVYDQIFNLLASNYGDYNDLKTARTFENLKKLLENCEN